MLAGPLVCMLVTKDVCTFLTLVREVARQGFSSNWMHKKAKERMQTEEGGTSKAEMLQLMTLIVS